jgi:hypothetical protein
MPVSSAQCLVPAQLQWHSVGVAHIFKSSWSKSVSKSVPPPTLESSSLWHQPAFKLPAGNYKIMLLGSVVDSFLTPGKTASGSSLLSWFYPSNGFSGTNLTN